MSDEVLRQRAYYAQTADQYDAAHIADDDEHGIALSLFAGLARHKGATSILDVGAGTGRALRRLGAELTQTRLVGVEPVKELREAGHKNGVPEDQLVDGDAYNLPFADNEFDFVIETGVLHHVRNPAAAVAEMMRVARMGVMISDANNYGQGSGVTRRVKSIVRAVGLWQAFIYVTTGGKMSKWSEGDGLYYSYSVFDNVAQVQTKFPRIFLMNTDQLSGTDLRLGTAQVCLMAVLS